MTENTQGGTAASPGTPAANPQQAPANTPDIKNPDVVQQPAKPDEANQPGKAPTRES